MRLVIDIPEEEYRWITKSDETVFADVASKECMLHAIKNGTPIPKCHGDLIDRSELLKQLYRIDDSATLGTRDVVNEEEIRDAQTIIEADKEVNADE